MTVHTRSLTEIRQDLRSSARERLPEYDHGPGSDSGQRLDVSATSAWHLQASVAQAEANQLPDLADEAGVVRWGGVLQTPRNGATVAARDSALRVTGVAGATIPADTELTYAPNGSRYRVAAGTVAAGGSVDLTITSITAGPDARRVAGDELVFDSPPLNVDAEAVLVLDLLGGDEQEPLEQWRQRQLQRFVESNALVLPEDWKAAAEALDTVDAAYIYPVRGGYGTLDMVVLRRGSGAVRALGATERQAVYDAINVRRPFGVRDWRVLETIAVPVNVELRIKAASGVGAWDWGDASSISITAYDAATRTLTLTSRPSSLIAGKRLVIVDAAGALDGEVSTVTATPGADQVVIDDDHGFVYAVGAVIYAAGGLVEPARQAVYAYIDTLGPARGSFANGTWQDSVRVGALETRVAQAVPEIEEIEVLDPVANVTSADPAVGYNSDAITLLVAGRVLVRRAP